MVPRTRSGRWLMSSMLVIGSLGAMPVAHADTIPEWNLIVAQTLATAKAGTGLAHSRVYAMVHGAMFDAVNAIDRRYNAFAVDLEAPAAASADAAAAVAAHAVLMELYPRHQGTLDAARAATLARIKDGPAKADGMGLGLAAAKAMLARRRDDAMGDKVPYVQGNGPGVFQLPANADPIGAHWGAVRSFTLKNIQEFRFPGPPPLTSDRYARDLDEVRRLGAKNSTQRTAEQTAIAQLWEPTSPITYNAILRAMPELRKKSPVEQAYAFALMNMAGSDALIVGWRAKYQFSFWRPETAIRSATPADAAWEGLRSPYPAHPEYPSGHALFTGAAETVLREFFGTDRMAVTVTNPDVNITRTFTSFSEIAKSVEDARVWAGIHFRSSDIDGTEMGRRVAEYALKNCMMPIVK